MKRMMMKATINLLKTVDNWLAINLGGYSRVGIRNRKQKHGKRNVQLMKQNYLQGMATSLGLIWMQN
jgi:hypothetical protein